MKAESKNKSAKLLKSAGLRRTRPRMTIIAVLLAARKPLTHEQITARLRDNVPNKVTIYRVLESLLEAGLVHKAFLHQRTWHYELSHNCTGNQCHPHFTCTNCGDTHCLTEISVPMAKNPYKGFDIQHQRVQFDGLCPNCNTNV